MTDSRAAAFDPDRLPWLGDEPPRAPPPAAGLRFSRSRPARGKPLNWSLLLPLAMAVLLLIAGASYWLGMRSVDDHGTSDSAPSAPPSATVPLPSIADAEPMPPDDVEAPLVVAPVRQEPEERVAERRAAHRSAAPRAVAEKTPPEPTRETPSAVETAAAKPVPRPPLSASQLRPWPPAVVEGASGRLVRIGTFASSRQAKKGWWRLMRLYPGMKRLKAVVVPVRSERNGRTYYRLQFGTTSQAHSEVLCQRMRMIGQSCVVIGVAKHGGATTQ